MLIISAYRLLLLYRLLAQNSKLSFENILQLMQVQPHVGKNLTLETIYKYINTLKQFGCLIHAKTFNGQVYFEMTAHPLQKESQDLEWASLVKLLNVLSQLPLAQTYLSFFILLNKLYLIPSHVSETFTLPTFVSQLKSYHSEQHPQLLTFQKYCEEGQVLEIGYCNEHGETSLLIVEPINLIWQKRQIYLHAFDPKQNKKKRFLLEAIKSHRQLPTRVKLQTMKTIVTFKLSGRTALNYRPYPGETILDKGDFIIVKNATDDTQALLTRLLKYGETCYVISPEHVQTEICSRLAQKVAALLQVSNDLLDDVFNTIQTDESLHKLVDYFDTQQTRDAVMVD